MKKQKLLVIAAGALICLVLYPPWRITYDRDTSYKGDHPRITTVLDWSLIVNQPLISYKQQSAAIAFDILTLEVLGLAAATFAAHLITWDKRK